ncbi:MAG: methyltransferase domain-containing protein [Candidatus Aegiribacteria sp.]|nr:methyltransferase domain-containing protein [Candidatus Aegiribacteria sp.]
MNEPLEYWDNLFRDLDPETMDLPRSLPASALPDFCDRYLKKGDRVLDLGCGSGRNAAYLAGRGFLVCGVDIAQGAVEFCVKRLAQLQLSGVFKQGTLENIPFPDNEFTAVVCIASLDHVTLDCASKSIDEIRRVLSESGVMLLTFDPPDTDEDIVDEAEILPDGTLKFVSGDQKGMLFRRYSDREITDLVGEENIISFNNTRSGGRTVVCR